MTWPRRWDGVMFNNSKKLTRAAKALAPEDIEPRIYVCILSEVWEYPPWCGPEARITGEYANEPFRVRELPADDDVAPLEVLDVCLPFVLVETPAGKHRMIDVRRYQLARLTTRYGRAAFKRLRPKKKKKRSDQEDGDDA